MSAPLFHHPDLPARGQRVAIVGDEAIHIARARRIGEGDCVHLTDGAGRLAECRVASLSSRPTALTVTIESVREVPPPSTAIALAAALPKGDAQASLLDMAVQLGIARFIPLRCARSAARFQPRMRARWERIVRSACKQCGQCRFPRIDDETALDALLAAETGAALLLGDRAGQSLSALDRGIIQSAPCVIALIGPEGGFDAAEAAALAQRGAARIALAPQVLRIETAAAALLAAIHQRLGADDS